MIAECAQRVEIMLISLRDKISMYPCIFLSPAGDPVTLDFLPDESEESALELAQRWPNFETCNCGAHMCRKITLRGTGAAAGPSSEAPK